MTAEAKKYLLEIGFDDSHLPDLFNDDDKSYYTIPELMEDYHKESSKKLVEAGRLALYFCERRQIPTEFELDALAVDLRKALENHLK